MTNEKRNLKRAQREAKQEKQAQTVVRIIDHSSHCLSGLHACVYLVR